MSADRRRGATRPASTEEKECWFRTTTKLNVLTSLDRTTETFSRVNRLVSAWPPDDMFPAEGLQVQENNWEKLKAGYDSIRGISQREIKAIDETLEQLQILIALRQAPEPQIDKAPRNKRPRGSSPSPSRPAPPAPQPRVAITVPPRRPSPAAALKDVKVVARDPKIPHRASPAAHVIPKTSSPLVKETKIPFSRDAKSRRGALARQLPLQVGRRIAFFPSKRNIGGPAAAAAASADDDNSWILARVTKCIQGDKNRYEVVDDDDEGPKTYNTTLRSIIPLPDPGAPAMDPSSLQAYQEFNVGDTVMALYPDTTCFYRAEVLQNPSMRDRKQQQGQPMLPSYTLKFDDDDNQEHQVSAYWVVEWPDVDRKEGRP